MHSNKKKNIAIVVATILVLSFALVVTVINVKHQIRRAQMSDKELFTDIYDKDEWGGWNGVGPGSTKEDGAAPFLEYLQNFVDSHEDITSIVDMGCGYGELLKDFRFPKNASYLGVDIVDEIIAFDQKLYTRDNVNFESVNSIQDLSRYKGDLLILKDVMEIWSINQIIYAKEHIIPNFKYVIIVNNFRTSWTTSINRDVRTGESRPLDLTVAPFFLNPTSSTDYFIPPHRIKRIYLFINKKMKEESKK